MVLRRTILATLAFTMVLAGGAAVQAQIVGPITITTAFQGESEPLEDLAKSVDMAAFFKSLENR